MQFTLLLIQVNLAPMSPARDEKERPMRSSDWH
jgi:hypothetical protein